MEELNPYAAPQAEILPEPENAIRARQKFLRTEGHLKSLGILIMVLSLMFVISKVMTWRILSREFGMTIVPWPYIGGGSVVFTMGLGLYFLKRWAGAAVVVLAVVKILMGLAQFPGGLFEILVQAAVLSFMFSAGARSVLSREHQGMIQQTPMVKSRAAGWIFPVMVLLALLVVLVFAGR